MILADSTTEHTIDDRSQIELLTANVRTKEVDAKIRGWIEYYGHHRRSDLYRLAYMIDNYLARFIKKKSKVNNTWSKAWKRLLQIKLEHPRTFSHWHKIGLSERRAV